MAKKNQRSKSNPVAPVVEQVGQDMDDHISTVDYELSSQHEPATDPQMGNYLTRFGLGNGMSILHGHIVMPLPSLGWYRVSLDNLNANVGCFQLSQTSHILAGARDVSMYAPDTEVVVLYDPNDKFGIILGSKPLVNEDGNLNFSDIVSQGSNSGLRADKHYFTYMTATQDEGGATDFSNHRPIDQTSLDHTVLTETGSGYHVDPFFTFMRVDEASGLFMFHYDSLVRLTGANLDIWGGAHTTSSRDDEGECTYIHSESPYPWEQVGAFEFGTGVHRTNEDDDVQFKKPYESKYEPKEDDQKPFCRYTEYGGYLGQARMREVCLPPKDVSSDTVNQYSSDHKLPGVFRETIGMDGSLSIQSSKSIIIAKRPLQVTPFRRKPVDSYDTDCDSKENANYKFAGKHGAADAHKIGDIANNETGVNKTLITVAAVLDMHAHAFNWKALHPFHYHAKDYLLPQESELDLTTNNGCPVFSVLSSEMWFPTSDAETQEVDHRYGATDYHQSMSHFSLTEDGQVVLAGTWGEELRFVGGNIQLSCPGLVMMQPGKSFVALGGDDIILRAKNSVDITATEHDVRVKAERNYLNLAGHDANVGGVTLFENRSPYDKQEWPAAGGEKIEGKGVIFRVPNAQFSTMSKEVYIRTGGGGDSASSGSDSSGCEIATGDITLDASKGTRDIRTFSNDFYRYMRSAAHDGFGITHNNKEPKKVNKYTQSKALICTPLDVQGDVRVRNGGVRANGSFTTTEGHFYYYVGGEHISKIRNIQDIREDIDAVKDLCDDEIKHQKEDYKEKMQERYYETDKLGSNTMQRKVSFSLREEEEYCTEKFVLPQTYWQILNDACDGGGKPWEEKSVKYQCDTEMMPWPGKKKWADEDTLLTLPESSFTMYNIKTQVSKDRPYEEPAYGSFEPKKPQTAYKVIDC